MSHDHPIIPCLSSKEMLDYTQGILSNQEQHRIEKHLLSCDLCSDALEGLQEMENPASLFEMEKELHFDIDSILDEKKDAKVKVFFPWKIAAAFALLFVSMLTLWMVVPRTNTAELAQKNTIAYPPPAEQPEAGIQEMQITNEVTAPKEQNKVVVVTDQGQLEEINNRSSFSEKEAESEDLALNKTIAVAPAVEQDMNVVKSEQTDVGRKTFDEIESKKRTSEGISSSEVTLNKPSKNTSAATAASVQKDEKASGNVANSSAVEFYNKGLEEYRSKNYAAALLSFEKCNAMPEAMFYAGVSYFLLDNPHAAIKKLENYIKTNHANYREAAYWYSGLSYLKIESKRDARKAFEKVVSFKGEFEKQATEMLKSL